MLLIDSQPIKRGNGVTLFLRENGNSIIREVEQPIPYFTRRVGEKVKEEYLEALNPYNPYFIKSGKPGRAGQQYAVYVLSNEDISQELNHLMDEKGLERLFTRSGKDKRHGYNYSKLLRWARFPPLSKVRISDGEVEVLDYASPEELQKERLMTFDIEVMNYNTNPLIYMISSTSSPEEDYKIFTIFNVPDFELDLEREIKESELLDVLDFKDKVIKAGIEQFEEEISEIARFSDYIKYTDPFCLAGYHIMGFDLPQLTDNGQRYIDRDGNIRFKNRGGVFTPGVDHSEPKIRGMLEYVRKFGPKTVIAGREVIDAYPYIRTHLSGLPNYKLETVIQPLIAFKKSMDYEEMERRAEICLKYLGSQGVNDPCLKEALRELKHLKVPSKSEAEECSLKLAKHNLMDAIIADKLVKWLFPLIVRDALEFKTNLSTATYRSNNSREFHDRRYFMDLKTLRKDRRFELEGYDERKWKDAFLIEKNNLNFQQGIYHAHLYFIPLIFDSFLAEEKLGRNRRLKLGEQFPLHIEALENPGENPLHKVMNLRTLEHIFDENLYDLSRVLEGKMPETYPKQKYKNKLSREAYFGMYGEDPSITLEYLLEKAEEYKEIIGNRFINHRYGFLLTSEPVEHSPENHFVEIGSGRAISVRRGEFLFQDDNYFWAFGIDPYMKGDMKTEFERKLFLNLITLGLENPDLEEVEQKVESLVKKEVSRLRKVDLPNGVEREELVFCVRPRMDHYVYSIDIANSRRGKIITEKGLKKDEKKEYGYLKVKENGARKEEIGVEKEWFLNPKDRASEVVAVNTYLKTIFGNKFRPTRVRTLLKALLSCGEEDIDNLVYGKELSLFDTSY